MNYNNVWRLRKGMGRAFFLILSFSQFLIFPISCIDFNDATEAISVAIQVSSPDDYPKANLEGRTITLSGTHTFTAVTDAQGIAHFQDIIPDVYNASASWKVSAEEYAQTTGQTVENKGYTVSGSLTTQTFAASTATPVTMATSITQDQSILIGKVYYQGNKDDNNKNYVYAKYVELYNNSDADYDVAGLYIALLESASPTSHYPLQYLNDTIVAKQVFQIPANTSLKVAPGGTLLLVNSAVDHPTKGCSKDPNLLGADFEAKDLNSPKPHENNPDIPELKQIYSFTNTTYMNLMQGGPSSIAIFETAEDVAGEWVQHHLTYRYGYEKGTQYMKIPTRYIIDAVDILKYNGETGIDVNTKRLFDYLDAGYAFTESKTGYDGRLVRRKVASVTADGRKILQDTNNSSNDFESIDNLTPRIYE